MQSMMTYKGYEAAVEYDEDAEIFHGEVINLRDVITFQGRFRVGVEEGFRRIGRTIWSSVGSTAKAAQSADSPGRDMKRKAASDRRSMTS